MDSMWRPFLTHRSLIPESVRILIDADLAAAMVALTLMFKLLALPISISVASSSSLDAFGGKYTEDEKMGQGESFEEKVNLP